MPSDLATTPIISLRDGPAPMRFPDPEAMERARLRRQEAERVQHAARVQREQEIRIDERVRAGRAIATATADAKDKGYRAGYVNGCEWGMVCGALAGAAVTAVLVMAFPAVSSAAGPAVRLVVGLFGGGSL